MRRLLALVLSSAVAAPLAARADGSILLAAKAGVARPFGDLGNGQKLADLVEWVFPLEAQAQVRISKQLSIGAYARYGATVLASGCSGCTGNDVGFGALAEWRFSDRLEGGPWIGAFAGYERLKSETQVTGAAKATSTASGFEGGAWGGVDFEVGRFTAGPYVSLSFGGFSKLKTDAGSSSIASKGVHGQLGGGVRGALLF
jgi:hypothetical protein